jgi:hypothetical protein
MTETADGGSAPRGVSGGPRLLLRLEGLALFLVALAAFAMSAQPWWLFFLLILAPDLGMLGYLFGNRAGAAIYNAVHLTIWPLALTLAAVVVADLGIFAVAMIWLAHIGIDRALGYGLKFAHGFGFTHLGRIGRGARQR